VAPPHTATHYSRSPPPPPPLLPYVSARARAQTQAQHGDPFLSSCPYIPSLPLHPSMPALPLQKHPWNGRSVVSQALQTVHIWNMQHLMYIRLTKVKPKKQMVLQFRKYLPNQEQWCSLNMIQTGSVTENKMRPKHWEIEGMRSYLEFVIWKCLKYDVFEEKIVRITQC
jgi:hypothetical protein